MKRQMTNQQRDQYMQRRGWDLVYVWANVRVYNNGAMFVSYYADTGEMFATPF